MEGATVTTIRVRMQRAYGAYKAGEVIEVDESFASRLFAWDYARRETQQSLIETAAVEPVAEQADVTPRRKGRRHE
jgi:hypothetical protein